MNLRRFLVIRFRWNTLYILLHPAQDFEELTIVQVFIKFISTVAWEKWESWANMIFRPCNAPSISLPCFWNSRRSEKVDYGCNGTNHYVSGILQFIVIIVHFFLVRSRLPWLRELNLWKLVCGRNWCKCMLKWAVYSVHQRRRCFRFIFLGPTSATTAVRSPGSCAGCQIVIFLDEWLSALPQNKCHGNAADCGIRFVKGKNGASLNTMHHNQDWETVTTTFLTWRGFRHHKSDSLLALWHKSLAKTVPYSDSDYLRA